MPVARFQLPDGRVARFEVPEGTTPEQAQEMVEKEYPNLSAKQATQGPEERSSLERAGRSLGRQVGLTARAGIEGIAAIPAMLANAPAAVYNKIADLVSPRTMSDLVTGEQGYRFPEQRQAVSALLTRLGLPVPQTGTERIAQDVAGAMAGQGGVMKVGNLMESASAPVVARIGNVLTKMPAAQLVGAGGSAGGSGMAREAGYGPGTQFAAGIAGGIIAPVAADVAVQGAKAAGRGLVAATRPFTQAGRERIVGQTLRSAATDPRRAVTRLEDVPEYVSGSQPTTAQAAADPGLLTAERVIRSGPGSAKFTEQASKANQARNILLSGMAGDDESIRVAEVARKASTKPMREAALESANIAGVSTERLQRRLRGLESQPGIRSSDVISKSLAEAKSKIAQFTNEDGVINAKDLYTIRKELGNAIRKNAQETQNWDKRLTGGLQDQVQGFIDDAIEAAGGRGWRDYLATYSEKSRPIEQLRTLQDVRTRVLNAGTDALTGEQIMSPAKFYNVVTKNESELARVLTPQQMANLKSIAADLQRGALSELGGRAAGSNTYQNLSTSYILGQSLGGKTPQSPLMQNLLRPLAWLNKLNETDLQNLLTDAMLDPALARSMMSRVSPRAVESVAFELGQRARALGIGAGVAAGTSGGRRRELEGATAQ